MEKESFLPGNDMKTIYMKRKNPYFCLIEKYKISQMSIIISHRNINMIKVVEEK